MFRDTLHLPVETSDNPFITPANIEVIKSFMQRVGYLGVADIVSAFYTKFLTQPWQTMFKVFNRCLTTRTSGHMIKQRSTFYNFFMPWSTAQILIMLLFFGGISSIIINEDYHSIKDDIPLVSVFTTWNMQVQGMLISDAFLTEEIRATNDYKEYETVFIE
nr:hypothetical protein [Tanacetum cinerariifolium]